MLNTNLGSLDGKYATQETGSNSGRYINFTGKFSAIVSVIGMDGNSYGTFFVQGYGIGSARIHFIELQAGAYITCAVCEDRESVLIRNESSNATISVFMMYGDIPTFSIT